VKGVGSLTASTQTMITYEQPLNEQIRLYLRLESLFDQLQDSITQKTDTSSKIAVQTLLKIASLTDRADIKSRITQILTQQTRSLTQLLGVPEVDNDRLRATLDELDHLMTSLYQSKMTIGEHIRKNDFLNQIRSQIMHPGGVCQNSTPAYLLWLNTPTQERIKDLKQWSQEFEQLKNINTMILKILRDSMSGEKISCENGLYQKNFDKDSRCSLIRISVPANYSVYPECSASRHRIIIRFLHPNYYGGGRAEQTKKKFNFHLACCNI
jgi:cell division protein ZapD